MRSRHVIMSVAVCLAAGSTALAAAILPWPQWLAVSGVVSGLTLAAGLRFTTWSERRRLERVMSAYTERKSSLT